MTPLDIGNGYVPDFIRDEILPNLPRQSGEGIHRALFDLARVLTPYRSTGEREAILRDYASQCGRHVPETEIQSAIRDGARHAWQPDGNPPESSRPPRSKFEPEVFKAFIAGARRVDSYWLAQRSPIDPGDQTPVSFLRALYRKGEKIIVFDDVKSQGQEVWTHSSGDVHALDHFMRGRRCGVWYLSNPTDGRFRLNDAGKFSRRSRQNVTSWRYMVVESDRTDIAAGDWLAAIAQLPLPIAAIYETGGRLPHALLRVDATNKVHWNQTRDSLAPLLIIAGADPNSLSAVRLTRLPCCGLGKEDEHGTFKPFENGPRIQRLLYLNPEPSCLSITQSGPQK
jgi:hypothetical protein